MGIFADHLREIGIFLLSLLLYFFITRFDYQLMRWARNFKWSCSVLWQVNNRLVSLPLCPYDVAGINISTVSKGPPRPCFEYTFNEQTIVSFADIRSVLSLFFRQWDNFICQANRHQELAVLGKTSKFLVFLLVTCRLLALQFLSCIGSFNDRISSFSIFNERVVLSFGLPLNRFVVMSLSFCCRVGPHCDIFLQRVDLRQNASRTALHYILRLLLFCEYIGVALGVIKFVLAFIFPCPLTFELSDMFLRRSFK